MDRSINIEKNDNIKYMIIPAACKLGLDGKSRVEKNI